MSDLHRRRHPHITLVHHTPIDAPTLCNRHNDHICTSNNSNGNGNGYGKSHGSGSLSQTMIFHIIIVMIMILVPSIQLVHAADGATAGNHTIPQPTVTPVCIYLLSFAAPFHSS
jgi:hypothetical protein